ncbi:N-acetylmuramic acid 6-phosphate etherase [Anthocerotibacter panamensis]|uniref:N-acetylmuramic acid 6-phosphate etherase n=1 Tax=Anthocerotibacter panamensis TaxID=2857077 RepID=UPI001C4082BB|nr:N-acetylmuramic acid 6-phosphate etherase [Anthocerotibacter panamensis]
MKFDPEDRGFLATEHRHPESRHLEQMSPHELVLLMNREDQRVVEAVAQEAGAIAQAIERISERMRSGGRLIYVGAGTSGRLGVLDAAECPPTFCTDPQQVQGVIAGGIGALTRSIEGAEDDPQAGQTAMVALDLQTSDAVLGIASGGTTPYVHGALQEAQGRGALTLFFACVPITQVPARYDVEIRPLVGPEILTGSTRLKCGTATKMVLNTISTGVMAQLGKVYDNFMVDVAVTNRKLHDRAVRMLGQLTGQERPYCEELLVHAKNQVKLALVMHKQHLDVEDAQQWLQMRGGSLTDLASPHSRSR